MVRGILILGSTGSIGRQALEVVAHFPEKLKVIGLSARENIELLETQARKFQPEAVAVQDEAKAKILSTRLRDTSIRVLSAAAGIEELARWPGAEMALVALVGFSGLLPTLAALDSGKTIALANKEALVVGGERVMAEAARQGCAIIPVDSEHSAIFQCLQAGKRAEVKRIVLTASGGPFFGWTREELAQVQPSQALKHPNWEMGAKITIDSATLLNKGFEVIEAHWLFSMAYTQIDVVIHPQSIVHSMVEFVDGAVMAQMGLPSMLHPIQYAFSFPDRWEGSWEALDYPRIPAFHFAEPDRAAFPCLQLAYEAGRRGGTMPAVLNAANEIAVSLFLQGRLRFLDIPVLLEQVMEQHHVVSHPSLEEIMRTDHWAREEASARAEEIISG